MDSSSCPGHLPLQKCQGRIKPLTVPSHLLQLTGYMPCLPWLHSQQRLQVYPQASQQLNLLSFGDCGQLPPTDSGPPIFLSPRATLHSSQEAPTQHCPANCLLPLNPAPSISSSPVWLTPHLLGQAFEDCPTSSPADSHTREDQGGLILGVSVLTCPMFETQCSAP